MLSPLRHLLGHGLSALLLALSFFTITTLLNTKPAAAAMPVIDGSLLTENTIQRILTIQQWAKDNINQIEQISRLETGNGIMNASFNLLNDNFAMLHKYTWQDVSAIQEKSLALLQAARAVWEEFGSANHYYASFHKAQAWENCMRTQHCSFKEAISQLDDSAISQSLQAYRNAEEMNIKLQGQIEQLQSLNQESQDTESTAATLDALSKINGSVASSMVDLNNQVAQLTKLQSHALAQSSNEALAAESYFKAITTYKEMPEERPLPYELP